MGTPTNQTNLNGSVSQPAFVATTAVSVTPSDSTVVLFSALYIGATGNLAIKTAAGTTVTFASVPAGFFPVSGTAVMATGTTASSIIALT